MIFDFLFQPLSTDIGFEIGMIFFMLVFLAMLLAVIASDDDQEYTRLQDYQPREIRHWVYDKETGELREE